MSPFEILWSLAMGPRRGIRLLALVVVSCLAPVQGARAIAENLVVNGSFDSDVSGWENVGSPPFGQWSPLDAAGSETSGSLRRDTGCTRCIVPVYQCLPVTISEGERFTLSGKVLAPSALFDGGLVELQLQWLEGPECDVAEVGDRVMTPRSSLLDVWELLESDGFAPPGAQSVRVIAQFFSGTDSAFTEHMDDVFVRVPEPSPALLRASAVATLAGLAGRRPRLVTRRVAR